MNCAPDLFLKHFHDSQNEDNPTFPSSKSFSCSDLPSAKKIVMKSSFDEMDGKINDRTKEISTEVGENNGTVVVKDTTHDDSAGDEKKGTNVTTQTLGLEMISLNLVIKEKMLDKVNQLRKELQQLSEATSSWKDNMREYLDKNLSTFEGIKVKEKGRLLSEKMNSDRVEELTKCMETLKKKIASINSENESLRKEIEAKDISFSEKELRYRNDLERQKQYATELESAKESFEAEQQIRFNSAIGRIMKEKEAALKKADEQVNALKLLQQKNDEKLQVLFNEKETLRQEKDEYAKKVVDAQAEVDRRKKELGKYMIETQYHLEVKEKEFSERLESERKEAALILEAEKMKWETESSGSGSGYVSMLISFTLVPLILIAGNRVKIGLRFRFVLK